jgi:hypothetical protein
MSQSSRLPDARNRSHGCTNEGRLLRKKKAVRGLRL